ncbi:MAG TPA: DMT family transporter [Pseudogracilibacillus sp.]|nr:DMT family transporter [Pseudogracilibacillus sp.]
MTRIYILLLIVMLVWGFNLSALVVLVNTLQPITLTAFRIFVAGIAVLLIAKAIGIFRLPTKSEWKTIMIITIFNVALHHSLLAVGLTKTSGVNASVILGAAPLMTMVLSVLLLKDRVSRIRVLGFLLGFFGIIVTSIAGEGGFQTVSLGDVLVFLSIFMQAFSFILISKLNPTFDPRLLTGYMLVLGSFFILVVALIVERDISQIANLFQWKLGSVFLFSAIVATAFGHMTYNLAIRNVGPSETTIFVNLNTLFAILGAALFLGEPILAHHYVGLVLIIVGVFFGAGTFEYVIRRRRERKHETKKS